MAQTILILGELPSLNEYIAANNRNRFIANKMKRDATELVAWQLKNVIKITQPAHYHFHWVTKDLRVDSDNTAFACKFVFDGLQEAGVLKRDSRAWVKSIAHTYSVGDPMVKITVDTN